MLRVIEEILEKEECEEKLTERAARMLAYSPLRDRCEPLFCTRCGVH